jgi:hypothetical protein
VRGVVAALEDLSGDQKHFAQILSIGLEWLEARLREDASAEQRATVLETLRINAEQALRWANTNAYVQFARLLMQLISFIRELST